MQAVEAKEGVEIQNETITLASISYQNFFRSYPVSVLPHNTLMHAMFCSQCSRCLDSGADLPWKNGQKLAGMTGTAVTEAAEFSNIYKLEVTEVPPNRPISRQDNPDVVFRTEAGAHQSITCHPTAATCSCRHYSHPDVWSHWHIPRVVRVMCMLCDAGKWAAAVTEIKLYHKQGRPVLVGTTSVERSEALAAMLKQEGNHDQSYHAMPSVDRRTC